MIKLRKEGRERKKKERKESEEKNLKRRKFEVPGMIGSFDVLNYDTLFLLFLSPLYFFFWKGKREDEEKISSRIYGTKNSGLDQKLADGQNFSKENVLIQFYTLDLRQVLIYSALFSNKLKGKNWRNVKEKNWRNMKGKNFEKNKLEIFLKQTKFCSKSKHNTCFLPTCFLLSLSFLFLSISFPDF